MALRLAVLAALAATSAAVLVVPAGRGSLGDATQLIQVPQSTPPIVFGGTVQFSSVAPAALARPGRPVAFQIRRAAAVPASKNLLLTPVVQSLPIVGAPKGLAAAKGANAFDEDSLGSSQLTPPDDAVCAGNGFVVAVVNNLFGVYNSSLSPQAPLRTTEGFFAPLIGGLAPNVALFDPRCYYDASTDRWFVTEAANQIPADESYLLIAASQASSPLGAWNEYRLTTTDSAKSDCPCDVDHLKLGVNADALFLSVNEFTFSGTPLSNGAQLYVVEKQALLKPQLPNRVQLDLGSLSTPDGPCNAQLGYYCWNSVSPSLVPDGAFEKGHGGTEYLLSSLDLLQGLDNRIELWAITNTKSIANQPALAIWRTTVQSETYGVPPLAVQKTGPIPLGDVSSTPPLVGPIQTNGTLGFGGDSMQQVSFAHGLVWGALTTAVDVLDNMNAMEHHSGIAYFEVKPEWRPYGLVGGVKGQDYIANGNEDVAFPAIAATKKGRAVISYVLTGRDYYPSTAVSLFKAQKPAIEIALADPGQSPNDDFCEYGLSCSSPRFGDYSASAVDGDTAFFGSQYIEYPNCSDSAYSSDPTCSNTRTQFTNWGTSLNSVPVK